MLEAIEEIENILQMGPLSPKTWGRQSWGEAHALVHC